jgi:hypothetical protein
MALWWLLASLEVVQVAAPAQMRSGTTTATQAALDRANRMLQRAPAARRHEISRLRQQFPISPQLYPSQGAAGGRRVLQASGAYEYSNQAGTMKVQNRSTGAKWRPLRVLWNTSYFFPTASNPRPDGARSCYSVGQWTYRGERPAGSAPAADCPSGQCTQCERDASDRCWVRCEESHVLTAPNYAWVQELLDSAGAQLAAMFEVESITGDMILDAQYECGDLPALDRAQNTDLVLFVHARPPKPGSTRAAYASSCQIDQHGRPISGEVG